MKALSKKALKEQDRLDATATLLTLVKPNDIVYTDIKSVSSSGMSRQIACYIAYTNGYGQLVKVSYDSKEIAGKIAFLNALSVVKFPYVLTVTN